MTDKTEDSGYQTIDGPDGKPIYVLLPVADHDRLTNDAQAFTDLSAATYAALPVTEPDLLIPADIVYRISQGESPVRVWREHRGMKAISLARATGISAPYLSEIETGKKDGTFRTMAVIAECLGVSLDDLAPVPDDEEREERALLARISGIKAQIRQIETLVVSSADFDTAAVRRAGQALVANAQALIGDECNPGGWLDEVIGGAEEILELVDRAEGSIIETAKTTRENMERVVSFGRFRRPMRDDKQETAKEAWEPVRPNLSVVPVVQ